MTIDIKYEMDDEKIPVKEYISISKCVCLLCNILSDSTAASDETSYRSPLQIVLWAQSRIYGDAGGKYCSKCKFYIYSNRMFIFSLFGATMCPCTVIIQRHSLL